ncbi:MAG: hypothetical protein Kow0047_24670 [Anaerolineae bacterium]
MIDISQAALIMGGLSLGVGLLLLAGFLLLTRFVEVESPAPAVALDPDQLRARNREYRRGLIVIVALGILTAVEYWIAVGMEGNLGYLALVAVVKAGLIIAYFMKIAQLWREEEGHA